MILQTSDNNENEKNSSNSDSKSGTINNQKVAKTGENQDVDDFGMTDDEWVAMFEAMTPDEKDAYLHSLWNYDQDNGTNQSGYYNSDYAQQVFAMVNAERSAAGIPELTWSEDLYNLAVER